MERQYYEAYDDRYRQVHAKGLQWFADAPSGIVLETVRKLQLNERHKLLEIGCGEGRDATVLMKEGFDLYATDISREAITYCRKKFPKFAARFAILDCIDGELDKEFDFIYAVAVLHMLVEDAHRNAFYRFIRKHLTQDGKALICTMGDGETQCSSDITNAFCLQDRVHEQTGTPVRIASTSCRMVSFETLENELAVNGFAVLEKGVVPVEPDFAQMMYAVVTPTN